MKKSESTYLIDRNKLLARIYSDIEVYFSDESQDYSHSIQHTKRVMSLAYILCKQEKGDLFVISLSALLHDIARSMEDRGKCGDHSKHGAKLAKAILTKYNIPKTDIKQVVYCIENHRSSSKGVTLEAKILRDADKLDSLGAICISRVIASSFQTRQYSRPIFNPKLPLDGHETASALHYLILLIQRYEKGNYFQTKSAKKLALSRIKIMRDFIRQFKKEWFIN